MSHNNPQRPQSALSNRPNVNVAPKRPLSSLSQRRPVSRQSHRPQTHQTRSKLLPLCQELTSQLTGQRDKTAHSSVVSENTFRTLETTYSTKTAATVDMATIDHQIRGRCVKARIKSQDTYGEALQACQSTLKTTVAQGNDLDDNIQRSRVPDHLQFLLALSQPPSPATLSFSTTYLDRLRNPRLVTPVLTWKDILEDERRMNVEEGGSGSDQSADHLESMSDGSAPSLSPWTSDDENEEHESISPPKAAYDNQPVLLGTAAITNPSAQREVSPLEMYEQLKAEQYWDPRNAPPVYERQEFDMAKHSTLGPALRDIVDSRGARASGVRSQEWYIDEHSAVREVLFALQGRSSILFGSTSKGGVIPDDTAPALRHLSPSAQKSILSSFSDIITTSQRLRCFVETRCQATSSTTRSPSVTVEAFVDGLEHEVLLLDRWCSQREEVICQALSGSTSARRAPVVSLLSTEKALKNDFRGVFEIMLGLTTITIVEEQSQHHPAYVAQHLLDSLHSTLHVQIEKAGESTPAVQTLKRLFVTTVEPMWQMVGAWIYQGVNFNSLDGRLEAEFFVERSGIELGTGLDMGLLDPDFWAEGYKLRTSNGKERDELMPEFFKPAAALILGAGKAGGLLRVLDPDYTGTRTEWPSFESVLSSLSAETQDSGEGDGLSDALLSGSTEDLARMVYDYLLPRCDAVGAQLTRVLTADCDLGYHASAIQGLYLMGQSSMLDFMDIVFTKMDSSPRSWADFHFLNTALSDVTSSGSRNAVKCWIQPALVRLSYRASMKELLKDVRRPTKSIEGLAVEYAVPFPLCYLFHPAALEDYNDVFVLLLQLRRARYVLEMTLIRYPSKDPRQQKEMMKHLYALRSRLSWIVNTLSDFFSTHVIQSHTLAFHRILLRAKTLDEMISSHEAYLLQMKRQCLLSQETAALRRGILTILDLGLQFSGLFAALAAGSDEDGHRVSRQTIKVRPHRSRRRRKLRRNTMSFSSSTVLSDSSEDDDDDDDGEEQEVEEGVSIVSKDLVEDLPTQVETVSRELDGVVRFLRRGVETLSNQASGDGGSFGVLEARLREWDL